MISIALFLIYSDFQKIQITIKFTELYPIQDVGCYLKFYEIERDYGSENNLTRYIKSLPPDYIELFKQMHSEPIPDNFFASNYIYWNWVEFDLENFVWEHFNVNFHLCGKKIFFCLRNGLGELVLEQFFISVKLSIKGYDRFDLEYTIIKHSSLDLPDGYYSIDFEDIFNFSRVDLYAMKLIFQMVPDYKKFSGYKLNVYGQMVNTIYYSDGLGQKLISS